MQLLTLDDLIPLDEYATQRREFFDRIAIAISTAIAASASALP